MTRIEPIAKAGPCGPAEKKLNRCAGCGKPVRTFQGGLCAVCLLPSIRRGSETITTFRDLLYGGAK